MEGRKFIEKGKNTAGYSEYEFKQAESKVDEVEDTPVTDLKLKLASVNEAGWPSYERVPEDLTEEQQDSLRSQLEEIGVTVKKRSKSVVKIKDENIDNGRRKFFEQATAAAAATVGAAVGVNLLSESDKEESLNKAEVEKDTSTASESIENVDALATFENEVEGYKALVLLAHDEIQFVDKYNRPVGEPQKFEDFDDVKEGKQGLHKYKPLGPEGDLATEWIDYVKKKVQEEHPDQPIVNTLHVEGDFQAALVEFDEPELVAKIKSGEIVRYIDIIVNHFGKKPVIGAEEYKRLEYVQKKIDFDNDIPEVVQNELRKIVPGLCAQESKFNAGLVSAGDAQAKGIFQFKEDTWRSYNDDPEQITSLVAQTKAAGELFADLYDWIHAESLVGRGTIDVLRSKFDNEDDFNLNLLVPLMVNSYNSGIGTMTEVMKTYVEKTSVEDMPEGKELFLDIANFGKQAKGSKNLNSYGSQAREYVTRVYAQAEVLNQLEQNQV